MSTSPSPPCLSEVFFAAAVVVATAVSVDTLFVADVPPAAVFVADVPAAPVFIAAAAVVAAAFFVDAADFISTVTATVFVAAAVFIAAAVFVAAAFVVDVAASGAVVLPLRFFWFLSSSNQEFF